MTSESILSFLREFGLPTLFVFFLGWMLIKKIQPVTDAMSGIMAMLDKMVDRLDQLERQIEKLDDKVNGGVK